MFSHPSTLRCLCDFFPFWMLGGQGMEVIQILGFRCRFKWLEINRSLTWFAIQSFEARGEVRSVLWWNCIVVSRPVRSEKKKNSWHINIPLLGHVKWLINFNHTQNAFHQNWVLILVQTCLSFSLHPSSASDKQLMTVNEMIVRDKMTRSGSQADIQYIRNSFVNKSPSKVSFSLLSHMLFLLLFISANRE